MTTATTPVSADEFRVRLAAVCLDSGGVGFPRRRRDRHILLMSVVLTLDDSALYTEKELNEALQAWIGAVGKSTGIDHVSLRRHLVDERYVSRDNAGSEYRLSDRTETGVYFEPPVERLDPAKILSEAREEAKRRKRRRPTGAKGRAKRAEGA
jgi:hypothetical protein